MCEVPVIILTLTLHYSNSLCCNIYKNFRTTVKIDYYRFGLPTK